jgi:hypothetical protein
MKSGGYLQFADIDITPRCDDGTMRDDTIFKTWHQGAMAFAELSRRRFFDAVMTKREIEDAGFVEIEEKRYKIPIGGWSSDPRYRELGRVSSIFPATPSGGGTGADHFRCVDVWKILGDRHGRMAFDSCNRVSSCKTSFQSNCDASLKVTNSSQWSVDRVKKVLEDTQDVLTKRNQHVYHYLYVDDKIFFSSERGLPVVLGLSSMRKSHSLFRLECPKSPGIFVPASILG